MTKPIITILLASHNRLDLLKLCVNSVECQLIPQTNLLIVDDGSDNATIQWLESLRNDRIGIVYQKKSGVAKARQLGLEKAPGEYILILDSDDRLMPDALKLYIESINKYPEIDLFYCDNIEEYPNGKSRNSNYPEFGDHADFVRAIFLDLRVPFKHSGILFKRDLALSLGGYDTSLKAKIDIDLMVKFLKAQVKFKKIDHAFVYFLFHRDSISRKRFFGIPIWWKIIDRYVDNEIQSIYFKLYRAFIEIMKWGFERIRLR